MITHVFLFRLTEEATEDQVRHFSEGLDVVAERVASIHTYRHGRDLGLADATWDYAVVAEFETVEDYRAYVDDPVHVEFGIERARPIVAEAARVQIEA